MQGLDMVNKASQSASENLDSRVVLVKRRLAEKGKLCRLVNDPCGIAGQRTLGPIVPPDCL